jgi:hypothetical protein
MARFEKTRPLRRSAFANEETPRTVPESDTATGREDHRELAEAGSMGASEINQPIGAQPRSEVTGRHDSGSGANETIDGLTGAEEALRRAAEDTSSGQGPEEDEDMPVFDRAGELPKV